ncbi:MAG TPA: HepT-like ribonuclease domain-containing protein [Pedobacter sp.]|jgi:uncharacterized protein with HEPN domain
MKREVKKYLYDIETSIESINDYLGEDHNFQKYQENKLLRRGVEREIEIIGEAMSKLLSLDPSIDIKSSRKIVDTRNWVIHGYDKVDDIIIWGIITIHLPILRDEIKLLLETE